MTDPRTIGRSLARAAVVLLLAGCAAVAPRPLPPSVALEAIRVTRFTPLDARLLVTLVVRNPNPYDLAVSALDANLAVEGEPLVTGSLVAPTVLVAGADSRLEIEARAGLVAIAAALDRASRQRTVRYEVTGAAIVQDGWRLPFSRGGELPAGAFLGQKR